MTQKNCLVNNKALSICLWSTYFTICCLRVQLRFGNNPCLSIFNYSAKIIFDITKLMKEIKLLKFLIFIALDWLLKSTWKKERKKQKRYWVCVARDVLDEVGFSVLKRVVFLAWVVVTPFLEEVCVVYLAASEIVKKNLSVFYVFGER